LTTKTRKHEKDHEEDNFFFVISCLRGPGRRFLLRS
jgi:hypothetical protein